MFVYVQFAYNLHDSFFLQAMVFNTNNLKHNDPKINVTEQELQYTALTLSAVYLPWNSVSTY
jgi:hypothetical protein